MFTRKRFYTSLYKEREKPEYTITISIHSFRPARPHSSFTISNHPKPQRKKKEKEKKRKCSYGLQVEPQMNTSTGPRTNVHCIHNTRLPNRKWI